jgi:hypothetical protein
MEDHPERGVDPLDFLIGDCGKPFKPLRQGGECLFQFIQPFAFFGF